MNRNKRAKWSTRKRKPPRVSREQKKLWWLAIENRGRGVSIFPLAMTRKQMRESWINGLVANLIVGFSSQDEQRESQRFLLSAPIAEASKRVYSFFDRTDVTALRGGALGYQEWL